MTKINGIAHCDICEKKLDHDRLDLYKRFRGRLKIQKHYCHLCFDTKIKPIENYGMRKKYNLLCKALTDGDQIKIGKLKLNVFEAVVLKKQIEEKYGFKENG